MFDFFELERRYMAKKIDYASLYTLRSDGRYQGYWKDSAKKRHIIYDRDPKRLYEKILAKEEPAPLTFRTMAERWYNESQARYKDGTWAEYDAPYKRAVGRCGDIPGAELTSADIADHLNEMARQGYGERTIKAQRTVYSLIYKYAAQQHDLVEAARYNPAAMAALPNNRKRPAKRKAPSDAAITKIIMGLNSSFGLFPYLLLCTGLRRGEALGLKWGDIDYRRNLIVVERGVTYRKGKKEVGDTKTDDSSRTVPMLPMLAIALKHYDEKDKDAFLFHGEDPHAPMSEATYRRRWHRWCRENGFANKIEYGRTSTRELPRYKYEYTLTAHVLRHGYATLSQRGGLAKETIRDMLGHVNTRTTEIYIHDLNSKTVSEYARISAAIEKEINSVIQNGK